MTSSSSDAFSDAIIFHEYLLAAASSAPSTERVGPFVASYDLDDANPYRNYAIPLAKADPSRREIDALVAAFARKHRTPRLEYVLDAAPGVASALTSAGFTPESRLPLLAAMELQGLPTLPPGLSFEIATVTSDLLATAEAQNEAYGAGLATAADLRRLHATVDRGGIVGLVRDLSTGVIAAGGLCTPPKNGASELAAIGTRPAFRRRGIAAALTAELASAAIERGLGRVFLMALHDGERRIYERAGFRVVAEMLHISLRSSGSAQSRALE